MNNVHLVSHTHWDREWYFTAKDSYVLITETFKRVVDNLEKNDTVYILDAQSSILEDFINFVPSYKQRTIDLIKAGRLIVGPWYTQTDCNYVGAESIIQNIKLGYNLAAKFGGHSKIAYLPDTFGFNMQMPAILKACSIDKAVIRRGLDYEYHKTGPYFKWQGVNGQTVDTLHLYKGYGELGHVTVDKKAKLEKYIETIDQYVKPSTSQYICLCGGDQTEINPNHNSVIEQLNADQTRKYNYLDSSLEQFFASLDNSDYGNYQGDLRLGRYDRVHRSIGSSRYDIKTENYRLENYIFKVINPLIAIAKQFDIDIEQNLVDYCIKKLAENQAHDSMGGCVTDEVYDDIMYRYKEVSEILDGIKNVISYRLHEQLQLGDDQVIIFNTSGSNEKLEQTVEILSYDQMIGLDIDHQVLVVKKVNDNSEQGYHNIFTIRIDEAIPTMGFKVARFTKVQEQLNQKQVTEATIGDLHFTVEGGCLRTTAFGRNIENLITLYDQGNDGDTYDFSPLRNDQELQFTKPNQITMTEIADCLEVTIQYQLELPVDLNNRISQEQLVSNPIEIKLLVNPSNKIKVATTVLNQALSHRLRIGFATAVFNQSHQKSVPFTSIIENDNELEIKDFENQGFVEDNLNLKVLDNVVCKQDEQLAVTVKTSGLKEYQVINDQIVITLFATTSEFGKGDLLSRPGRASGDTGRVGHKMIATPKAEYLGLNKFDFELDFSYAQTADSIAKLIDRSTSRFVGYQMQVVDKFINRLDNKLFDIETIKTEANQFSLLRSELPIQNIEKFKDGYLVRIENPAAAKSLDRNYFGKFKIISQTDVFGTVISKEQFTAEAQTCSTFYVEGEKC